MSNEYRTVAALVFLVAVGGVTFMWEKYRQAERQPEQQIVSSAFSCSDKELESVALHVLAPELNHGPTSVAFELGYGQESELNAQRARLDDYRSRIQKMRDPRLRAAYLKWIDFWQQENDDAREEMVSGTKRRAWLEYQQQQKAERAAIKQRSQTIPRP